ncbi:MAG: HDOD domain-containing protein [Anaerolineae bacterium]|nr:HDOD domain-containing protein [Anaerolineae bacterium]
MTAKILQLVNSAFFGLPGKITSPQRAVTILGVNTIKALVLGIQVFGEYQASAAPAFFSIDQLWRHSLQTGSIAKAIAASAGLEASLQDEAQLAGVLHDVGKLLQLKIPAFFQQVKVTGGAVVLSSEYEAFGVSHAELGAYLLSIWGLPGGVVGAVAYHHRPQSGATGSFAVLDAVHIANGLWHWLNAVEPQPPETYFDLPYLQRAGLEKRLEEWKTLARNTLYASSAG